MNRFRFALLWFIPLVSCAVTGVAIGGEATTRSNYVYATNGVKDHIVGRSGSEWKVLLDESNLGGKELEMVELTLQPGTVVGSHMHGAVEIIYVLSGTYEYEVNGKLYRLTPGMVGLVRPGDHVRHRVPKSGAAKLLVIWTPGGEVQRVLGQAKGTAVSPLQAIEAAVPAP
jgi:quercetin dioxygenase-like cupin family protein